MEEIILVQNGACACGVREPSWENLPPPKGNIEMLGDKWSRKYRRP